MNMYMGFSSSMGPQEGAVLIFAHTAREAKKIGWPAVSSFFTMEYTDMGVRRITDSHGWLWNEANQDKLRNDVPHVNDNPHSCKRCEMWGHAEILENGFCEDCNSNAELDEDLCDCGIPFPKNGKCNFCGARSRY